MRLFDLKKELDFHSCTLSVMIDSVVLGQKKLWFSVDIKHENKLCSEQFDAFLVGLIFPAMIYGENIHVEGSVSLRLLTNINQYIIPLLRAFSDNGNAISITANNSTSISYQGQGIGASFSGGIDSFCTIYDHYQLETNQDNRINNLLFLNVGSHGTFDVERIRSKFTSRYNYLKQFPYEIGLELISIDSNLYEFHPWGHQLTCSLTMVSGILLMQKHYQKYYCSSLGWSYLEILQYYQTDLNKDISILDPVLLTLLSTESLELIPDGTQYTRVEKTLRLLDYEPVKRYLNVCVSIDDTHENCSICDKCCRTLMTLDSIGRINDFTHVFDINKYRTMVKKQYICQQVLRQTFDPFAKGNVELAKANHEALPNKLVCLIFLTPKFLKEKISIFIDHYLKEDTKIKLKKIVNR